MDLKRIPGYYHSSCKGIITGTKLIYKEKYPTEN